MSKKIKVILYCRVSDNTLIEGIAKQKNQLVNYCKEHGYNVVEIVQSVTNIGRENDRQLFDCLRKNKGKANKLICVRWDRLFRNLDVSVELIRELIKTGIEPETISKADSWVWGCHINMIKTLAA